MTSTRLPIFIAQIFSLVFLAQTVAAQAVLRAYVFEANNRGYLNQAKASISRLPEKALIAEVFSDAEGMFFSRLEPGEYRVSVKKDLFFDLDTVLQIGAADVFLKMEMRRKPGYLFDATVAEARETPDQEVDAIQLVDIEIYNRTQKRPELVLRRHPEAFFQFTFEQGNHYTILVRKPGFLAKRIEAYVNIEGCIICVHGVQNLRPGITENMTAGNSMGTLLCNIELERARLDKRIAIRDIYYDFEKWDIRPDAAKILDDVVHLMTDNSGIAVELGSHTDARGGDEYNLNLSQKRAESAVQYIVNEGIAATRITAKGYGETQLTNRCRNEVPCSEAEHQQNRRTELRITGISTDSLEYLRWQSLEEIVREEEFRQQLKLLEKEEVIKIKERPMPLPPGKKPGEKPTPKPMPEANNSVPLPKFEPQAEIEQRPEEQMLEARTDDGEYIEERPYSLPKNYNGYSVEVLCGKEKLPYSHPIFEQFVQIFLRKDTEGNFCYLIGRYDDLMQIHRFYQREVKPKYPAAQICLFTDGEKTYVR